MAPHQQPPLLPLESHAFHQELFDVDLFPELDSVLLTELPKSNAPVAVVDQDDDQSMEKVKKGEKRKLQIREASRRSRVKQKDEVTYLRARVTEMEQILRENASMASTSSSAGESELATLRRENHVLTKALQRTKKQLSIIQTLIQETIQTPLQLDSPSCASSSTDVTVDEMSAMAAAAASNLLQFNVAKGVHILKIHSMDWTGDLFLDGSQLRYAMIKQLPGNLQAMVDRVWKLTETVRGATENYTLVKQECVMDLSDNLRIVHRIESVLEMRLLEHRSLLFRHNVSPRSILIGTQSITSPSTSSRYTRGSEQQGVLLASPPDNDNAVHVHLCGVYDCVGVPDNEITARFSKDILHLLTSVEAKLLLDA
ncbi:hypothetical protein Ae201684P_018957 [Aphanomyces euteiches]|uniref:BZIP domain-containing protein n=2 Tax=Aphanomyces euteiches TaxID=100861 RepID=A0A6G0XUE7_9STRA|nr:hypothetical protein Ae201684_001321 [Aphanomyces euteiches]KAH9099951.1 hypothetical protein Ae201684P_018957 [Aphanomyces euteiches]KAH9139626.1 hypothetical protein AeRB84_016103 [Aphanomyces euteiches]